MSVARPSIIFCGTPAFAVPSLRALLQSGTLDVCLAITQPDRPAGRGYTLQSPPIKDVALRAGIPVLQPESLNAVVSQLPYCDFLVTVAYGQLLSRQVLAHPRVAPVNVHASLLPTLRGASPIQHAILLGHAQSGVTVQRMEASLDTGPILSQASHVLSPRETASTLHDALSVLGAQLLVDTLSKPLHEQAQDHSKATYCRKLSTSDGVLQLASMDAMTIDRMVRALTPWPGVRLDDLKILATSLAPLTTSTPILCAGNTTLHLVEVQPAGRTPMSGAEWSRGYSARKPMKGN